LQQEDACKKVKKMKSLSKRNGELAAALKTWLKLKRGPL